MVIFKHYIVNFLSPWLYKSAYSRALFTLWGVCLKELRVCFGQFFTWRYPLRSLWRVLSLLASVVMRLLLGRSTKFSYAYTGEDRIVEGILKPKITQVGFYVDVGCNHPTFLSNTYGLYRKGWRGICVDANSILIHKYRFYRPKDKAICALASDKEEVRNFYLAENDVLSTTTEFNRNCIEEQGLSVTAKQFTTKTLTRILDEANAPKSIDLLSIDAEEHDFQVLKSLDLSRYHVKLILLEEENITPQSLGEHPICKYLFSQGYELEGYILKNIYFIKNATLISSLES